MLQWYFHIVDPEGTQKLICGEHNSTSSSFFCRPRCLTLLSSHSVVSWYFPHSTTFWFSVCLYPLVLPTVPIREYKTKGLKSFNAQQRKHSINHRPPIDQSFPHSTTLVFCPSFSKKEGRLRSWCWDESPWQTIRLLFQSSVVTSALPDHYFTMEHYPVNGI